MRQAASLGSEAHYHFAGPDLATTLAEDVCKTKSSGLNLSLRGAIVNWRMEDVWLDKRLANP
jgi:hypothetical protein